jgi:hypothetical protein
MHVNKTVTTDALTSMMGSRAFSAVARAVLRAIQDGDTRLLCFPKSNLGPQQRSYSYTIKGVTVGNDPDDGQPITTGAVEWVGVSDRRAEDVLEDAATAAAVGRPSRSARDRAKAWIRDQLAAGPVAAGELKARAAAAGFPEKTLSRAADDLNVVRTRQGFGTGSTWALPDGGEAAGQPGQGDPEDTAPAPAGSGDPASHSRHQPPSPTNGLNGVNDVNGQSASPLPDLNDLNGLNDSNGANGHENPPASHSRHSRQSGHSGGGGSGDVIEPWEAGPARPDTATAPAALPSEPETLVAAMLRWHERVNKTAEVKP